MKNEKSEKVSKEKKKAKEKVGNGKIGKKSAPSNIIKHDSSNWNLIQSIQSIQSIQLDGLLHAPIDMNIGWTH